jgi:hypothetical protein
MSAADGGTPKAALGPAVGEIVERFELDKAWLVDPVSGREGPGEIVVTDGVLESVVWLEGAEAAGVTDRGVVVAPGFFDLHAHFREPGFEDAETVATGSAAAAHGGYTTVAVMPNTQPALDDPGVLARIEAAARASGSPVEVLAFGAVSAGRAGEQLSAMGELADAGVIGFSDDGAPVKTAKLLRSALLYAGMLGLPVVDHAEDAELTAGAEAHEGYVASVMGLAGWPTSAEVNAVSRDLAILADALGDEPKARLHLTHVSTAAALDLVRQRQGRGLARHLRRHAAPSRLHRRVDRRLAALVVGGARRRRHAPRSVGRRRADGVAVQHLAARQPAARYRHGRRRLPGRAARRHCRRRCHGPRPAHGGGQGSGVRPRRERHQWH